MMFFAKFCVLALSAGAFLLSGCASQEPVRQPRPDKKEQLRLEQRAGMLKEKIKAFPVCGVILERDMLSSRDSAYLVERLKQLGFNRVLLPLAPGDDLDEPAAGFVMQCRRAGIGVYGYIRQSEAVYKPSSNLFLRKFFDDPVTLAGVTAGFAEQNRELPAEQQLTGFVLDMAPHTFTSSEPFRPSNCPYSWGKNRFGKGLDNEALIQFSLREVQNACKAAAPFPVMVQVPDFYHDLVRSGNLPPGTLAAFSTAGTASPRELILLNSGNKPSELFSRVESELKETPSEIPVLVAVNLAPHSAVAKGELRRRNWNDLVRSVSYAAGRYRSTRKLAGLVLGPYSRLEILLEEK